MRVLPLVLILLSSGASWAEEQTLAIQKGPGGATGTARLTQRLMPDGSKVIQIVLVLKKDGSSVTVTSESVYASSGRPVRKIERTTAKGILIHQVTAEFGRDKVNVTMRGDFAEKKMSISYPTGPIEAKSEFWVIRDAVAPGAVETYQRLDMASLAWKATKSKAVGRTRLKIAGREVDAYVIQVEDNRTWLGKGGRLLRLESPTLVLQDQG